MRIQDRIAVFVIDIISVAPDNVLAKDLVLEVHVSPEAILVVQDPLANRASDLSLNRVLNLEMFLGRYESFEDFIAEFAATSAVGKFYYLIVCSESQQTYKRAQQSGEKKRVVIKSSIRILYIYSGFSIHLQCVWVRHDHVLHRCSVQAR